MHSTQSAVVESAINGVKDVFIFCKDMSGGYTTANQLTIKTALLQKPTDIIGKTDKDLIWAKNADLYREKDNIVLKYGKTSIFSELMTLPHLEDPINLLTIKSPIHDHDTDKIIGLLGISHPVNAEVFSSFIADHAGLKHKQFISSFSHYYLITITKKFNLTVRESECLMHLSHGLSTKMIAKELKLSPRTIECHINRLKDKCLCSSKQELMSKFIARSL